MRPLMLVAKKAGFECWIAETTCPSSNCDLYKSSYFLKPSDVHNILHLNINGLNVNNLINFMTPFPLLESMKCTAAIFI